MSRAEAMSLYLTTKRAQVMDALTVAGFDIRDPNTRHMVGVAGLAEELSHA